MIVVGLKNHTFALIEGMYDNGKFVVEKVYESSLENDIDDLNDSNVRSLIVNEINKVITEDKMATEDVAILISNNKLKKYIFETDPVETAHLSLKKLLAGELSHSLDMYFHPEEKNYYLIEKIGKNGTNDVHLVLEMNKNITTQVESFKNELSAKSVTVVPEWSGLFNFLEEFKDSVRDLIVVDDTNLPYLEITAIKNGQVFNVFGLNLQENEPVQSFLSDFIQTHYLENPPSVLQLGASEILEGLNINRFDLDQIAEKLQSSSNLNLHHVKSFFSLIGIFK